MNSINKYRGAPNMTASVWPKWDRYEWYAWIRVYSDMTETLNLSLTLIWLRRLDPNLHIYDWDAPKNFVFAFRFYTLETATRLKITTKKIGASQSYLCKFGSRRLSHISVNGKMASQSYHCKIWFKRLTYISISSTPRVSLISVSIGSFRRSHIRHPPIIFRTYLS